MAAYSVQETKSRLSEVLRLVKTRREVIITENGKPIAKIVPIGVEDEESLDERLERLRAAGQLRPAAEPSPDRPRRRRPSAGAVQRFLDDRDQ